MPRLKCLIVTAALALGIAPAHAVTFDWSFVSSGFTMGGTLEASPIVPGTYLVTAIAGTDMIGDTVLGPGGGFGVDNLLYYPAAPGGQVDGSGISFLLAGPTLSGELFVYHYFASFNAAGGCISFCSAAFWVGAFSASPAAVPLPAALPFFATGLGAIGLLASRRKRQTAAA
jgi:hypothetical protein